MATAGVDNSSIVQSMAPGTMFEEPPLETVQPETTDTTDLRTEPVERQDEPPSVEAQPGEGTPEPIPTEEAQSYEDLLPARQQKVYGNDLLTRAAEKFGVDAGLLDNQGVRSLLKGKIDADILIASRERESEIARREQSTKPAEAKPETQTSTELAFPQVAQMTRQIAASRVTDEGANFVGPMLYKSLSDYADAVESGDQAKVQAANRDLTTSFTQFGVMLMAEMSPVIFAQQFQAAMDRYEGGREQETSLYDEAAELLAKEPGFRDLQDLRSKGEIDRVAEDYFQQTGQELSSVHFRNRETGQALPPLQDAIAQFRYAVRLLRGEQYVDPAEVAQRGVEAGRRRERANQNRTALGRFSSGRQSGAFDQRSGDDADDFMGRMRDAVTREAPMSDLQFVSTMLGR